MTFLFASAFLVLSNVEKRDTLSKYRKEIGAFIYQKNADNIKVMLVTNRQQTRWILPKGQIEKGLTDKMVAHEEAYEEAGIIGEIDSDIQQKTIKYTSSTGPVELHVYTMQLVHVFDQWPENHFRKRKMVNIRTALEMVKKMPLRKLISEIEQDIFSLEKQS